MKANMKRRNLRREAGLAMLEAGIEERKRAAVKALRYRLEMSRLEREALTETYNNLHGAQGEAVLNKLHALHTEINGYVQELYDLGEDPYRKES